ncbi:TRAP transporter permease [Tropicimonas isoalkanivorans]|uniref:TRAP transporter, 4TM/12TM fusion protein n=1 Tax=Tropicimonas isoalkanivorans TaxID=441112 RepID=A0A1I1HV94_9RHOB|nr:TRAP transporter fused permease subunit [Tropicimonas isoalkanivorans]SFC25868.1 TRAP transporter, 4TM/12TM fusion protein [Tropicimonas isoalkanivorans]
MNFALLMRVIQVALSFVYVGTLLTQFFNPMPPINIAAFQVYMAVALVFAFTREKEDAKFVWISRTVTLACVLISLAIAVLYQYEIPRLERRLEMIDPVFPIDIFMHVAGVILILEAVRRSVGMSLVVVVGVFIAYGYFGFLAPGWMSFPGFTLSTQAEMITMQTSGIFGVTASAAVNFVFFFVLFGAVFSATGGGPLFIDLAMRATSRLAGGAAKMSLVGSALFGVVSGSAIANTTSTGVLTIPIMHRSGYSKEQAAATEAIASTGGQLMPPVMGIAAFVMADLLGIPYLTIAAAGLIPALAFYFALIVIVDLRARKSGVGNISAEALDIPPILPRLHLLLAPIAMIATLVMGYSAPFAALTGTILSLVVPFLRKSTWYPLREIYYMVIDTAKQMGYISAPLAAVGIVMVIATQSNLALKFVSMLTDIGGSNLYLSLVLVIFGCIIMGMGLPTVAAYIIGSLVFVPALTGMGVDLLAANLFVLYYCVLSMVTPPVALCTFAAAGIAGSNVNKTGILAFKYALVIFLVPFAFVNDPHLLWQGAAWQIGIAAVGLVLATFNWAVFLEAWLKHRLNIVERLAFLVVSLSLVVAPTLSLTWVAGIAGSAVLFAWCFMLKPQPSAKRQGA